MSTLHNEIDLDADGRHVGYLRLPYSVHRSAYGWIPIPIASVRNGDGPVVLLMGGNHGDEYEGQVLVSSLIREIEPQWVRGQLIFLPMANFPAAAAGLEDFAARRRQPEPQFSRRSTRRADRRDCRLYRAHAARTRAISDRPAFGRKFASLPRRQYAGHRAARPRGRRAAQSIARRVRLAACISASAESGSCGERRAAAGRNFHPHGARWGRHRAGSLLRDARRGLLNLLGYIGVLSGPLVPDGPPAQTRFFTVSGSRHYVYAYDRGVYEPLVELGDQVVAGQPAARIHFPDTPLREPVTSFFASAGEVVCKRCRLRWSVVTVCSILPNRFEGAADNSSAVILDGCMFYRRRQ